MKATRIFLVAASLMISSMAFAEGGGDRVFESMMKSRDLAASVNSQARQKPAEQEVAQERDHPEKPHC